MQICGSGEYLGQQISPDEVRPSKNTVEEIVHWPVELETSLPVSEPRHLLQEFHGC